MNYNTGPHIDWWKSIDRFAMLKKYGYQDLKKPWIYRKITDKGIYQIWFSEHKKRIL